jgi:hypothetical protein
MHDIWSIALAKFLALVVFRHPEPFIRRCRTLHPHDLTTSPTNASCPYRARTCEPAMRAAGP